MSLARVQIRNVPRPLHQRLKSRAALEGMTMSDYILREISKSLEKPSRQEVLDRMKTQRAPKLKSSLAALVRAERDAR
jgi:antitoxin FitA